MTHLDGVSALPTSEWSAKVLADADGQFGYVAVAGSGQHEGLGLVDRVAQVPPVEDADDAARHPKTLVVCGTYKNSRTCSGTWMSKSKPEHAVFYRCGTRGSAPRSGGV